MTVKGNDAVGGNNTNTGLPSSDIFYFGNIIGDTFLFTSPVALITGATDEIQARANGGALVPVTNPYDFNKDSFVNATDQIIARSNGFILTRINISNPPAAPVVAPAAAVVSDDGRSGIASALAVRQSTLESLVRPSGARQEPGIRTNEPARSLAASGALAGDAAEPAVLAPATFDVVVDVALDDELLADLTDDVF